MASKKRLYDAEFREGAVPDSIIALSMQSPTEPIEGSGPEALARWVNARDRDCTP